VKKRNELLGLKAYITARDKIKNQFSGDYAEGLKAILVGVQSAKVGARDSAANAIDELERFYFAGIMHDVSLVEGGLDILASGAMDREIARALSVLETGTGDLAKMDVRAVGLAKAFRKWQEAARVNANRAGAWIGKDAGYITKQAHDSLRISADREGWMAMMVAKADLPRMMEETGAESVDKLLGSIWEALASGIHLKSVDMSADAARPGLKGMARRLSQERVIHFKSADDWMDYNEAFGGGNRARVRTRGAEEPRPRDWPDAENGAEPRVYVHPAGG